MRVAIDAVALVGVFGICYLAVILGMHLVAWTIQGITFVLSLIWKDKT